MIKQYEISETLMSSYHNAADYIFDNFSKILYGFYNDTPNWKIDWDYIDDILLETDEFITNAKEAGFNITQIRHSPSEVYQKITNSHIGSKASEVFFRGDAINEILEPFLNALTEQINDLDKYITNNENINILECDVSTRRPHCYYIIEFDDSLLNEVKKVIEDGNKKAEAANNQTIIHVYNEKYYNLPFFGVEFSNPGSLNLRLTKSQPLN